MREIDFRICYTAQNGEKSFIYRNGDNDRFLIALDGTIYENYGVDWQHPKWDVMFDGQAKLEQYTGVNDKEGKKIYEGDTLLYRGRIGIVEFFAGNFICGWDDQTDEPLSYMTINEMEVVGNTFGV